MEQLLEAIVLLKTNPKQATIYLNAIYEQNQQFFNYLVNIALSYEIQKQLKELALIIFSRYFLTKMKNLSYVEYLVFESLLKNFKQILYNQKQLTFKMKTLIQPGLKQFINHRGIDIKIAKQIITNIPKYTPQIIYILFQAILDSNVSELEKIQLVDQFQYELMEVLNFYVERLMKIDYQHFYLEKNQSFIAEFVNIIKKIIYFLERLKTIVNLFNFKDLNLTYNTYRSSVFIALAKNQKLNNFILYLIAFKYHPENQTNIICVKDIHQMAYEINQIKSICFQIYVKFVQSMDVNFDVKFAKQPIFNLLPATVKDIVDDILFISGYMEQNKLDELHEKFIIMPLLENMFKFLTFSLNIHQINKIFHVLDAKITNSLIFPFIQLSQSQLQLFETQPTQFNVLIDQTCFKRQFDLLKTWVIHFIVKMIKNIDGFTSYFFSVCSKIVIKGCHLQNAIIVRNQLEEKLFNYPLETGFSGLLILSQIYYFRQDIQGTVVDIWETFNLQNMKGVNICQVYHFLKKNHQLFRFQILNYYIMFLLQLTHEQQAICQIGYEFFFEVFAVSLRMNQQRNMIRQNYCKSIMPKIFQHISICQSDHFYVAMNQLVNYNQNSPIYIQQNINTILIELCNRLHKQYRKQYPNQHLNYEIFTIIKSLVKLKLYYQSNQLSLSDFIFQQLLTMKSKSYDEQDDYIEVLSLLGRNQQRLLTDLTVNNAIMAIFQYHRCQEVSQNWYSGLGFLIQTIQGNFKQLQRETLYKIIFSTLITNNNLLMVRMLQIYQLWIYHRPQEQLSQQSNHLMQQLFKILHKQYKSQQKKQHQMRAYTIITMINTYLLCLRYCYKQMNQIRWIFLYGNTLLYAYNKWAANVVLEGLWRIIDNKNNEEQFTKYNFIDEQYIEVYCKFCVQILIKLKDIQKFDDQQKIDKELRQICMLERNVFNLNDPFKTFNLIMTKLHDKGVSIKSFQKNVEISILLQVEQVQGNLRKMLKVKPNF